MSLVSLVLVLRPQQAVLLPSALGRAAHAALLRQVALLQPQLAQALHDGDGPRPFTCSSLLGGRRNGGVSPETPYTLRYTALAPDLAALLPTLFQPDSSVELDGVPFKVQSATTDPAAHPWAQATTYQDLSARWLLGREAPAARLALHLASPTAFKSNDKTIVFPSPDLVFGSLLDKWNAFAPVAIPQETRRFAAECLAVSRYRLSTIAAPFKSEGIVKFGAVGTITYSILNHDRYWMSIIHLLADYAQFAGIGAGAALGMGQARRIDDASPLRR